MFNNYGLKSNENEDDLKYGSKMKPKDGFSKYKLLFFLLEIHISHKKVGNHKVVIHCLTEVLRR